MPVESLETDGDFPFGFWILIRQKDELIFDQEGSEFLAKRVNKSGLVIEHSNPAVDKAWRIMLWGTNTDEALPLLNQVLQKNPHDVEALFGLGYYYQQISWKDRNKLSKLALSYFQIVLQRAPLDEDISKAAKTNIDLIMLDKKWAHDRSLSKTPVTPVQKNEHVSLSDFPSQDLPTAADRENLIGESAKNFYYGVGEPVDYKKSRIAALLEMDSRSKNIENEDRDYYSAPSILMMIYANGFGVQKNIDLSIRLAKFYVGGTPSEIDERIKHIKRMNNLFHGVFDVCDDIPIDTGIRSIYLDEQKVDDYIRGMMPYDIQTKLPAQKTWSREQIDAFNNLEKVANDYFTKRIYNEIDLSGTGRGEYENDETNLLENDFLEILGLLENKKIPECSHSVILKSDFELNETYKKALKINDIPHGTITSVGIRVVQRRWIAYCDAWIKFAALRYPKVPSDSLRKVLTDVRNAQLSDLTNPLY